MSYSEQAQEIDRQMLLDDFEAGQIVVDGNACIVNEDIERIYLLNGLLDLRGVSHVQAQGRHALISDSQFAARSCIDFLCSPSKRLIHKRPADAAIGASDR